MSGYKGTLDKVLKKFGMTNRDALGTVWSEGTFTWDILNSMGYNVEKGINKPTYDFVVIAKKASLADVLEALTKINIGGIIVFKLDALPIQVGRILASLNRLNGGIEFEFYDYTNGVLGVLLLGKECR